MAKRTVGKKQRQSMTLSHATSGFSFFFLSLLPALLSLSSRRALGFLVFLEVSLVRCAHRCIKKYPLAHSFPVDGSLSLQQVCWALTAYTCTCLKRG